MKTKKTRKSPMPHYRMSASSRGRVIGGRLTHEEHLALAPTVRHVATDMSKVWDAMSGRVPKTHRAWTAMRKVTQQLVQLRGELDNLYHQVTSEEQFREMGNIYHQPGAELETRLLIRGLR